MKSAKALKRLDSVESHLTAIAERYKTDDKALLAAISQLIGNLASVKRTLTLVVAREAAVKPAGVEPHTLVTDAPARSATRLFRGKRRSVSE